MNTEIERVYVDQTWLGIGGNTPWNIKGRIEEINIRENDPCSGSNVSFIFIHFDTGNMLKIKTTDYMAVYKREKDHG